jgi:hypothetical protein
MVYYGCEFVSAFSTEGFAYSFPQEEVVSSRRKPVHPARERGTHQPVKQLGHHIRPQKRSIWNCQIETEADTLGTWALRWEAAEAKKHEFYLFV